MPDSVKSIDPKQSKVVTSPSEILYRRIPETRLLRAHFTPDVQTYKVRVLGERCDKRIEDSTLYDELHPLIACGRAIVEFRQSHMGCSINHVLVEERIVQPKK